MISFLKKRSEFFFFVIFQVRKTKYKPLVTKVRSQQELLFFLSSLNKPETGKKKKKKKSTVIWKWELLLHTNDVSSFGEEVHYGERYCPKVTVFLIVFDFLT